MKFKEHIIFVILFMGVMHAPCMAIITERDHFFPNEVFDVQLPQGKTIPPELIPHFPNRLYAFIWRNWNLVTLEKMAQVLKAKGSDVEKLAKSMGLPDYKKPEWEARQIYITLIRRNWHLLPYEQLLDLVEMTPEQLNFSLREDDFLWVKLGMLKPQCGPLYYETPGKEAIKRAQEIRSVLKNTVSKAVSEEPRFAFVSDIKNTGNPLPKQCQKDKPPKEQDQKGKSLRFIYSYFALYGDPLLNDDADIFPDGLLGKLSDLGVNGIWLHVLLRDLAPGGKAFPEFGANHEIRLKNLRKTVEQAKKYHIDIYLYLNEPRSMPVSFFENPGIPGREQTKGVREGDYCALCTSNEDVRHWMMDALTYVFTEVPELGGVFTISGSENLTYCNSHGAWQQCPSCREKSGDEVIADANALIAQGVHRASPEAKVIIWDWGWNRHGIATGVIDQLPENVWLMSVSEWGLPIERGGVQSKIGEYAISAVGPGERAQKHWHAAKANGLKTVAKVQFNCTWEIAAVPFVPVMDLIAEHCSNLSSSGVDGYLLSWTLGGYPSPNLEIPQLFDRTPVPAKEEVLDELALKRYGEKGAPFSRKAWTIMSDAYREYPFSGGVVYYSPVQIGPANLFRPEATGYSATMSGIPYDDLNRWRSIYPAETFARQFEKMASGFAEAIPLLEKAVSLADIGRRPDVQSELRYAKVVRIHFASIANQVRYILLRDQYNLPDTTLAGKKELSEKIRTVIENEIMLAKELYYLVLEDSRIGFESANQYFYVPNDLLEKIISSRQILDHL
ncbi:MAG: hypothetical protein AB2L24_04515 [Mangrovibacterium sp.]